MHWQRVFLCHLLEKRERATRTAFMRNLCALHPLQCCSLPAHCCFQACLKTSKIFYFGRTATHLNFQRETRSQELCPLFVHTRIFLFAGCSLLTLRKWMKSQPAHPGAPRCLLGSWCQNLGAQAAEGGCTASASPPAATAWPGSAMTAPCQWLMPPKTWCEYPLASTTMMWESPCWYHQLDDPKRSFPTLTIKWFCVERWTRKLAALLPVLL